MPDTYLKFDNTDLLHDQYTSGHVGVVRKVNDPEGRGRVRVEFPGLRGTGEENWSDWIDVAGNPIGGQSGDPKGDTGIWWPLQPGQSVVGHFMTSDPDSMYCIPGFAGQDGDGENKQDVPRECKACDDGDHRDPTKIFQLKTPDGGTLMWDTREGKESLSLLSRKGTGLQIYSPSKLKKQAEQKIGESKYRQSDFRGTKSVFANNADGPDSLKNGEEVIRLASINGTGFAIHDKVGQGIFTLAAYSAKGTASDLMITMDTKSKSIILSAFGTQLVVNGTKGQVEVTKQVIQEKPSTDAPKTHLAATDSFCASCNADYSTEA